MVQLRRIHWLSPVAMLGAFIAGIFLAVGHHLFYASLEGSVVPTSTFVGAISDQEAIIALGTAFAFFTKACLVYAVGIAYIQVLWGANRLSERAKPRMIKELDCVFSAFDDIFSLLNVPLWARFPTLFSLAAVGWMIPIASIFTPATLSIRSGPVKPALVSSMQVPNLDFASLNFVADMPFQGNNYDRENQESFVSVYPYSGAHSSVLSVADKVMSAGSISPILAPAANVSWITEFPGPSLKCSNISETVRLQILENIAYGYGPEANRSLGCGGYFTLYNYRYLAWSPRTVASEESTVEPFQRGYSNEPAAFFTGTMKNTGHLGLVAAPEIFIMTIPSPRPIKDLLCAQDHEKDGPNRAKLLKDVDDVFTGTTLQCKLHNSTYRVAFTYTSHNQSVSVQVPQMDPSPQSSMKWYVSGPMQSVHDRREQVPFSRNTQVSTCPRLYDGGVKGNLFETGECGTVDWEMLQSLSYQAVFEAFWRNIKGSIDSGPGPDSRVLETELMRTHDLHFLKGILPLAPASRSLKQELINSNDPSVQGLVNDHDSKPWKPLAETIEEMFQNLTVSLMSIPELRPNYSSISAPPPSNVTFHTYESVYNYSARKMWLAYGISIGLTAVAVAVGFMTIAENNASYGDNFSTIFRAARGAHISTTLLQEDLDGKDPTPEYISKAKIQFMGKEGDRGSAARSIDLAPLPDGNREGF